MVRHHTPQQAYKYTSNTRNRRGSKDKNLQILRISNAWVEVGTKKNGEKVVVDNNNFKNTPVGVITEGPFPFPKEMNPESRPTSTPYITEGSNLYKTTFWVPEFSVHQKGYVDAGLIYTFDGTYLNLRKIISTQPFDDSSSFVQNPNPNPKSKPKPKPKPKPKQNQDQDQVQDRHYYQRNYHQPPPPPAQAQSQPRYDPDADLDQYY